MAQNKMGDLRNHLFETIELLKDGIKDEKDEVAMKMTVEKAKVIKDISQTLINSAKLEIAFIEVAGRNYEPSTFFKPNNSICSWYRSCRGRSDLKSQ